MSAIVSDSSAAVDRRVAEQAGYASERVYRMLSFALALADLVLLLLNLSSAIAQAPTLSWEWSSYAIATFVVPPVAVVALVRRASTALIRRLWAVEAIATLSAYALVPLILTLADRRMPASLGMPWLVEVAVFSGSAAALAWRARYAVLYLVALQISLFALVFVVDEPIPGRPLGDASRELFFVTFFVCLAFALRRAGALLDDTVIAAVTEARAQAAREARRSERQRIGMLVHDSVIVALLSYVTGADSSVVPSAQRALEALADAGAPEADAPQTPLGFVWGLQAITTDADPDAEFGFELSGDGRDIPPHVVSAIVEATSEALRNSVLHAAGDRPVTRQVHVSVTDEQVDVVVLDDGAGFDVRSISPGRLGISAGIVGRLRAIAGAQATVTSRAGYGTTVAMRWTRS